MLDRMSALAAVKDVKLDPKPGGLPGSEVLEGLVNGLAFWGLLAALAALVAGEPGPGPPGLHLSATAWMRGVAEAASEPRRPLLHRLREGRADRGGRSRGGEQRRDEERRLGHPGGGA